jgi:calcium-dependent protein kinase
MGVLCLKCETSNKDKDDSEDNINEHKERNNELPKQYVNYIDFSEKTEGEETILKFENDEPTQKKIQNNNNDKNKNKQTTNILNKYAKAKSTKLKNKEETEDNFEKIINEINEIKDEKPNENEYSGRKNKQFPTVVNPQELKNNLGENNKKASDELDLKKVNKSQRVVFQRRKKKSTTLMENSKILQQLFLAEMSIPISQELLVLQQKGNPSDKYIRGKKIGKGTFGTVYESKNIIFNNKVAMKIIPKDYHMDNLLIKNEIDILKKLSHPNIVRIYEFYESNNCFYIINEFCPEGELYDYINNSKLNEQQLAVIFYQVFSGLKYLHENNILHRDLKPENILISKKEKDLLDDEEYFWIQIIDFGTAKIFENDKNENSIVGSAYYIAPEVLNKDYNEKCDTWSVGVILYMFLVGRPPFNGKDNVEIVESIKTKNYDENNPKLLTRSPEVRDLIKHLIEKDVNKRLSAKEALNHEWFKKYNGRKLFGNFQEKDIQPYINNLFNYTFNSKIQQLVIAFLVHNLPHTESSHNILKMYRYFNKAGDCRLTKEELKNGLNKYRNEGEVNEKVDNLFLLLDGDNNGYIEFEEFLRACIDKKEILNDEYLKYAFKFLDKQNKNMLSAQQINSAFLVGNNKLFEIAITNALNEVDENGDGMINFEEFKILMLKTMN